MAFQIVFGLVSLVLVVSFYAVVIVWIVSLYRKKFGFDQYILPLDQVDAQKLTSMVDEQIELYIGSLMKSKGYSDEQIKEILTNKPLGQRPTFRR
jgi:SNF family Na+-dependent transporter